MPADIIKASTQEALSIENIRQNLVLLKNGGAAMILQVNAINFSLLSEREQDAIIYAYGGLLNSLNFSIQILIRSQKKDISGYLDLLEKSRQKQENSQLQELITSYQKFIKETVTKGDILDKKFYLVIPFSSLEMGAGHITKGILKSILPSKKSQSKINFDMLIQKAKTALDPKRDHLIRLLGRIGLVAHQLSTNELIRLFFRIYNPDTKEAEDTLSQAYTKPIVQATQKQTDYQSQQTKNQKWTK